MLKRLAMLRRMAHVWAVLLCCIPMYGFAEQPPLLEADTQKSPDEKTLLEADSLNIRVEKADSLNIWKERMQETDSLDIWGEEIMQEALDSAMNAVGTMDSLLHVAVPEFQKTFTPDPIRSFWLSLIIPGAGQIYNHKFWKLPVVYGGFLGCVYALSWNSQMLRDYTQAYLDIMDDDPETQSYMKMLPLGYNIEGREERFKTIFKRKKDYYRKYRDMSIFAFAGVYLISVLDAYVDAELSSFDIRRDLSLKWEPTQTNNDNHLAQRLGFKSYGVQCSLTF